MTKEHYHFIGVAGIGMSGLAKLLCQQGYSVSGSDQSEKAILEDLRKYRAQTTIAYDPKLLKKASHVVYSSAIKSNHPELLEAKKNHCQILHRSELLAKISKDYVSLAIAGSHGKTSSSSLLSSVFLHAGKNPSFALGGILKNEQTNASLGEGKYFILEADESDGSLINYFPDAAIITNIDSEHLDHYGSKEKLFSYFEQFIEQVKNHDYLFVCSDDPFLKNCPGISYGFNNAADLKVFYYTQKGLKSSFSFHFEGHDFHNVDLNLVGKHNILNAAAVFGLSIKFGLNERSIRQALKNFQGVKRRADLIESINGISLIDDYAHHPSEIKTTLQGFRAAFPKRRLLVAFEPHRYTRTRDLMEEFHSVFEDADTLLLTDICPAGQKPIPGIDSELLLNKIQTKNKFYIPKTSLKEEVLKKIQRNDVFISMGAGSIASLNEEIHCLLNKKCRVACVQGGISPEHDVSLISAQNIASKVDTERFEIEHFYISKDGYWSKDQNPSKEKIPQSILKDLERCDLVFPVLHGPYGEDGTLQGFFQTLGLRYVGSGHRSCSISMDKALMKHIVRSAGFQTANFIEFRKIDWEKSPNDLIKSVYAQLKPALFVKPSHLGSSIGISRIETKKELQSAVEIAFSVDDRIIVEEEIKGRELEFAILEDEELLVAGPGEIIKKDNQFYDEKRKSLSVDLDICTNANLSPSIKEKGKEICRKIFKLAQCSAFARIDFFLNENNEFIFNEINPLPGFTPISLYPKLFEKEGICFKELLERLFKLAKRK